MVNPQSYVGGAQGGGYRNVKGRNRVGIGQSVAVDGQGYTSGSGPYSVDRNAEIQASLNAMQIQTQSIRERPTAVSLQKKPTLSKRLEPLNVGSVGSPLGVSDADRRLISPNNVSLPKTTTGKGPL